MAFKAEDLNKTNHFVVDYRSCPTGIGTIFLDNGKRILVTDMESGPKDMEEARSSLNPEHLPDSVIHIPLDSEYYDIADQVLGAILVTHRVVHVVDTELAHDYPELTFVKSLNLFTSMTWLEGRGVGGLL